MGSRLQGQGPVVSKTFSWYFEVQVALVPGGTAGHLTARWTLPDDPFSKGINVVGFKVYTPVLAAGAPSIALDLQAGGTSLLTAPVAITSANDGAWVSGTLTPSGVVGVPVLGGVEITIPWTITTLGATDYFDYVHAQIDYNELSNSRLPYST